MLEELNVTELQVLEEDSALYLQAIQAAGDQTETIVSVEQHWVSLEGGYAVALDAHNP